LTPKDGKSQQAYQQVIALKDSDETLKPIQSIVVFANFKLGGPIYASVGTLGALGFTLSNLAAGMMTMIFAAQYHLSSAAWCIIAGIILDMLDGRVACLAWRRDGGHGC